MQSGRKQTWNTWRSNFRGMKIHRQWKFVRKLRKSCGLKVWKLAEYFKESEWIILRILTWRLFLKFRHVCARPSGLQAPRCDIRHSTGYAATAVSVWRPTVLWYLVFSPVSPAPCQDRTPSLTSTNHYHPVHSLLSEHPACIWHLSCKPHSCSPYDMQWGQRNSWISSIV